LPGTTLSVSGKNPALRTTMLWPFLALPKLNAPLSFVSVRALAMSFGSVLTVTAALWTGVPDSSTIEPLIPACAVEIAAIANVAKAKTPILENFIITPYPTNLIYNKKGNRVNAFPYLLCTLENKSIPFPLAT
jgi:hypothetical protein